MENLKCRLMYFDRPNANGRRYSKDMIEAQLKEYIGTPGGAFGCLSDENSSYDLDVNLVNISHRIDNYCIKDNQLYLDIRLLDTPKGKLAQALGADNFGLELVGTCDDIDESGEVTGLDLAHIDLIEKSRCAWPECEMYKARM